MPSDINISESELKRVKSKNLTPLGFSPSTVIKFHDAAVQFGRMAVLCAAKAGEELNQIKANCQRGDWMKIIESMPFSAETARNYRKLADQMTERFLEQGGEIDLLSLPEPEHLADPEYAETLRRVQRITGEQGLRQLYFDWGIMSEPKKKGGARPPSTKTEEEIEELVKQATRTGWMEIATTLNSNGLDEMTWAELEESEIRGLLALCTALADKMQKHLTDIKRR